MSLFCLNAFMPSLTENRMGMRYVLHKAENVFRHQHKDSSCKSHLNTKVLFSQMKKGEIETTMIAVLFDAVILVVIALILFGNLASFQRDITFEKKYIVRDIAMLLTTVQTFAGDVQIEYQFPVPLSAKLTEKEITLSHEGISLAYPFSRVITVLPVALGSTVKVTITKKGNMVTLS